VDAFSCLAGVWDSRRDESSPARPRPVAMCYMHLAEKAAAQPIGVLATTCLNIMSANK
jgi:hypothetical protein